jgi:hypothetical protein
MNRKPPVHLLFVRRHANPEGPWSDWGLSTRAKMTLENLTPLKMRWARARANGAAGSSDWTEPTCRMVI